MNKDMKLVSPKNLNSRKFSKKYGKQKDRA